MTILKSTTPKVIWHWALNAKVQGDDDEIYVISRTNEVVIGPLRYGDKDDPYAEDKKPWWKFW